MAVIASLRVTHPTANLDEFLKAIGMRATRVWQAGEQRRTPKGDLLEGRYEHSYAAVRLTSDPCELSLAVQGLTARLLPHAAMIQDLVSSKGRLALFVSLTESGESLGHELLSAMGQLSIDLELDTQSAQRAD